MIVPRLIERKRDGERLEPREIRDLVLAYAEGAVPDYQMAALLMAIYFRGLDRDEMNALMDAMLESGKRLDLTRLPMPRIDKHSTGGVGDKTSLILAPLIASIGVAVPMMSGRGLGHTGGTLDKLESIPGFRTALPLAEATRLVTVVAGIRLAADAVVDLWSRETAAAGGDRAASREELYGARALVTGWYSALADALRTGGPLPSALPVDSIANGRLIEAARRDLQDGGGQVTPTAARMIWTADHLDAVRRLQDTILGPAHHAAKQQARSETRMRHFIRTTR